jgi:hypothetical protein
MNKGKHQKAVLNKERLMITTSSNEQKQSAEMNKGKHQKAQRNKDNQKSTQKAVNNKGNQQK